MIRRPGGELATRPLHFIWLADASGSMSSNGKIQALNNAIREVIPHMQTVAQENPNAEVLVRAVTFSSGARWHIAKAVPVRDFRWTDLQATGETDLGKALDLVAEQLQVDQLATGALPPVLVLVSDGLPTDRFEDGLRALLAQPWGARAVRIAIAIGEDADLDCLQRFIGNSEIKPLRANNPEALVRNIRWVSTTVLKTASSPPVLAGNAGLFQTSITLPPPPDPFNTPSNTDDIW